MAIRKKIFIADEIYFITFTVLDWKKVFTSDKYCQPVYKWFDYIKKEYSNKIYGYVIMPNHIHLLIYISNKSPKISTLIMNAKRFIAYEMVYLLEKDKQYKILNIFKANANTKKKAKHKVFTDRYDSLIIESEKFFRQKLNYIHNNPCQAHWQLAHNPEDYKYSSAANYILNSGYYDIGIYEF